jgi:hypothetical protein
MPGNSKSWGFNVSEGDLNTETGEISPDRGNSCNKSNTSRADAPGNSTKCSLFTVTLPVYTAGRQVRDRCSSAADYSPATTAAAPRECSAAGSASRSGLPFGNDRGDAHAQLPPFGAALMPLRRHWKKIWSTNPLERLNEEIKRRTGARSCTLQLRGAADRPVRRARTGHRLQERLRVGRRLGWPGLRLRSDAAGISGDLGVS